MPHQGNESLNDPDIDNQREKWGNPIAHFDLKPGNTWSNTNLSNARLLGCIDLIIPSSDGGKERRRP